MAGYTPPISRCYICHSTINLITCPHCSAIEYCSPSHSSQDSTRHSPECNNIQKSHRRFQSIHNQIKATYDVTEETMSPLFNFYAAGKVETNGILFKDPLAFGYVTSSDEYSISLFQIEGSFAALKLAYDHEVWMHNIASRYNEPGMFVTNSLLLRGEDRLCFRYARLREEDAVVRSFGAPAVELREALVEGFVDQPGILEMLWGEVDIMEYLTRESGLAIVLILFWWVRDLKDLESFREVEGWFVKKLNRDVVHMIVEVIPQSGFVLKERLYQDDNLELIKRLEVWMEYYFLKLYYQHNDFWTTLLEPIEHDGKFLSQSGSARGAVELCWRAWRNTPGAVDHVRGMIPKVEKWVKDRKDLVAEEERRLGPASVGWEEEQMIIFGGFLSVV